MASDILHDLEQELISISKPVAKVEPMADDLPPMTISQWNKEREVFDRVFFLASEKAAKITMHTVKMHSMAGDYMRDIALRKPNLCQHLLSRRTRNEPEES